MGALNRELASSGGRSLFSDSLKLKLYQLRGQLKFSATDMQKSELFLVIGGLMYVCVQVNLCFLFLSKALRYALFHSLLFGKSIYSRKSTYHLRLVSRTALRKCHKLSNYYVMAYMV